MEFAANGGSTITTGYETTDTITIMEKVAPKSPLILVEKFENRKNTPTEGVLGMGFSAKNMLSKMKEAKSINKAIFSLYLGDEKHFMILGDEIPYLGEGSPVKYDYEGTGPNWYLKIKSIKVGGSVPADKPYAEDDKFIFDTTVENIIVPTANFEKLTKEIGKKFAAGKCAIDGNFYHCDCEKDLTKFNDVAFEFSGKSNIWTAKGSDYAYFKTPTEGTYKDKPRCYSAFEKSTATDYHLGTRFFKGHYIIFDQDNKKISIQKRTETPIDDWEQSDAIMGVIIGLGLAFLIIAIIIILLILKPLGKKFEGISNLAKPHARP